MPQDRPSSAGSRKGSFGESDDGGLLSATEEGTAVVGEGVVRDTPSWKGASDICILLGV